MNRIALSYAAIAAFFLISSSAIAQTLWDRYFPKEFARFLEKEIKSGRIQEMELIIVSEFSNSVDGHWRVSDVRRPERRPFRLYASGRSFIGNPDVSNRIKTTFIPSTIVFKNNGQISLKDLEKGWRVRALVEEFKGKADGSYCGQGPGDICANAIVVIGTAKN